MFQQAVAHNRIKMRRKSVPGLVAADKKIIKEELK
jgi:hypothetical protein